VIGSLRVIDQLPVAVTRVPQTGSVLEQVAKPLQVERPATIAADGLALRLPTLAVALKMAVFELDACPLGALGDESDLDLAGSLEIRLDLPLWADIPTDHDSLRRLVGENTRPAALAPIHAAVIDVTAHARFEHRLGDLDAEQVVLPWLDAIEFLVASTSLIM
jgi:hypothetical protein